MQTIRDATHTAVQEVTTGVDAASVVRAVEAEARRDQRFALRRIFTAHCSFTDPRNTSEKKVDCQGHKTCWHNAGITDTNEQIRVCDALGIPLNQVFGVNPSITFRTERVAR